MTEEEIKKELERIHKIIANMTKEQREEFDRKFNMFGSNPPKNIKHPK